MRYHRRLVVFDLARLSVASHRWQPMTSGTQFDDCPISSLPPIRFRRLCWSRSPTSSRLSSSRCSIARCQNKVTFPRSSKIEAFITPVMKKRCRHQFLSADFEPAGIVKAPGMYRCPLADGVGVPVVRWPSTIITIWLRVPERIQYLQHWATKSFTIPRRDTWDHSLVLHTYLVDEHSARSACTNRLEVPYFELSTIGGRAFPLAASQIWNSLPDTVVSASTLLSFQHQLKTFLFQRSIIY